MVSPRVAWTAVYTPSCVVFAWANTRTAAITSALIGPPSINDAVRGSADRQARGVTGQIGDARVEGRETAVRRLPLHVAIVDLLDDDGDLEDGEDLVVADVRHVTAGARGVARDHLIRRQVAGPVRHRRQRVALFGRRGRPPVREQDAEVDQRI